MLDEPRCFTRGCKHLIGVVQNKAGDEESEVVACAAFPNGIPDDIAYGDNPHEVPVPNQGNQIIFEKG